MRSTLLFVWALSLVIVSEAGAQFDYYQNYLYPDQHYFRTTNYPLRAAPQSRSLFNSWTVTIATSTFTFTVTSSSTCTTSTAALKSCSPSKGRRRRSHQDISSLLYTEDDDEIPDIFLPIKYILFSMI